MQQTYPIGGVVINTMKYQNGTRKVSLVVKCPLFRGTCPLPEVMHFSAGDDHNMHILLAAVMLLSERLEV